MKKGYTSRSIIYFLILLFAISCQTNVKPVISNTIERKWWKEAIVYQIYPRSFKDSDGDGIGDLNKATPIMGNYAHPSMNNHLQPFESGIYELH